ncbi:uncharacterized protein MONBRDRAFT_9572 [Monosiga brevicollis MX1]|uniref:Cyclin-like domain-containing protein n=1 Tax=Monosiga brevicollis TaxID=81824 RepID=A9V3Q6_MONBE|nr:uncharacterized protein MONBRDRAFT_9572 [Monosiga brevicollis MX1]EDQ87852.1 predicted protein [Monosiga brevicollis MX1]|eukprot:XP_001747385.1 hypothetical protein [Monosiga brevicollis MX1]
MTTSALAALNAQAITSEVHRNMRVQESQLQLAQYCGPLADLRPRCVQRIHRLARAFRFHRLTRDAAIFYFDRMLFLFHMHESHLELAVQTAFLMAAKCQEAEEVVPTHHDLHRAGCAVVPTAHLKAFEASYLERVDWILTSVTPSDFLDYYARFSISSQDCLAGLPLHNVHNVEAFTLDLADQVLQEASMANHVATFLPSHRAAAAITTARLIVDIKPAWSPTLQAVSGLTWREISPCVDAMLQLNLNPSCHREMAALRQCLQHQEAEPACRSPHAERTLSMDSGIWSAPESPMCADDSVFDDPLLESSHVHPTHTQRETQPVHQLQQCSTRHKLDPAAHHLPHTPTKQFRVTYGQPAVAHAPVRALRLGAHVPLQRPPTDQLLTRPVARYPDSLLARAFRDLIV